MARYDRSANGLPDQRVLEGLWWDVIRCITFAARCSIIHFRYLSNTSVDLMYCDSIMRLAMEC